MSTISIMCVGQSLKVASSPLITAGDENEDYVQFSFCSSWNGYAKVAIFYRNKSELHYSIVGNDNRCTIPNSMLIDEGVLCIGVVGFKNDSGTYKTRTTEVLRYNIAEGALQGESIEDPTLAELFYKQIENAEISEDKHLLIHLMDNTTIDAGEVAGGGGDETVYAMKAKIIITALMDISSGKIKYTINSKNIEFADGETIETIYKKIKNFEKVNFYFENFASLTADSSEEEEAAILLYTQDTSPLSVLASDNSALSDDPNYTLGFTFAPWVGLTGELKKGAGYFLSVIYHLNTKEITVSADFLGGS
jgi:hypothetical protein